MKIQMTLEVPDPARKYIASLADGEVTETTGLATREAVTSYIQAVVARPARRRLTCEPGR